MNRKQRRAAEKLKGKRAIHPAKTAMRSAIPSVGDMLTAGLEYYRAGQLDKAEQLCRQILLADDHHAESFHLLGMIAYQKGQHSVAVDLCQKAIELNETTAHFHNSLGNILQGQHKLTQAVACYERALALNPGYVQAHNNLGVLLHHQGKLTEAVQHLVRALALKPDYAEAHGNLGNVLRDQGKLSEAAGCYERALTLKPDYVEAHNNLGNALRIQGKLTDAVACYERALTLRPDYAIARNNVGTVLRDQGKLTEAVACFERTLMLKPDYPDAHNNLGTVLSDQGKLTEAVACFERALTLKPEYAEADNNLGNVLHTQGKLAEAAACYERALIFKPDYAEAHNNLGNVLRDRVKLTEAVACYERALALKPDYAEANYNLGGALQEQGKVPEAVAFYERALALKPDYADACSSLSFCLNYDDKVTAKQLFAAHCDWNKRFGRPDPMPMIYANNCLSERRLRVGYVSPDLRHHSVAYFIEPLLKEHDRQLVEIHCYADVAQPDAVTARLRSYADHWLGTVGLSDGVLAERIRSDSIDILVDLAGHTGRNRLAVFARKPAPVQVTWLGYPNTTGLDAIDYRLVDAITDPPGTADAFARESLVRIEGGFLCYAAPNDAPVPTVPPCMASGMVTFGSFNNPTKLSPTTLDTWAKLLKDLPQSRLLLKGRSFIDAATRAHFLSRLDERGVGKERVELVSWLPSGAAHLALYDRVDIALDPFPYNGTTTTCEALWMGVPVVTLRADRHAGRVGTSLLSQVGLTDWIAGSIDDYVAIAANLAASPSLLTDFRQNLRPRIAASPLCDAQKFARKIEAAYRKMWSNWCGNSAPKSGAGSIR